MGFTVAAASSLGKPHCDCGKLWYACTTHHDTGFKCRRSVVQRSKGQPRPSPPLGVLRRRHSRVPPRKATPDDYASQLRVRGLGEQADFSRPAKALKVSTSVTDGVTGLSRCSGPHPKRQRLSSPLPTQAMHTERPVKRKQPSGAQGPASTTRLVDRILAKSARLAEKLGEATARPPG